MPIYEYKCQDCGKVYERLELSAANQTPTSRCPHCAGVGNLIISAPAIVFELFGNPKRLPDWDKKQAQAVAHDKRVVKSLREPLERDRGQGIKVYQTEFGCSERERLLEKSQRVGE